MSELLTTVVTEGVARIQLDDGKANALSFAMLDAIGSALDVAEKEASAVVLAGRPGRFCAGFDLSVLGKGGSAGRELVASGARLCLRLLDFPVPVVAACSGHAIAAGALLVLSCDWRIATRGAFKVGLNEVAIGMALPHFARKIARARLSKRHLARATVQAEMYTPEGALDAGYFDALTDAESLLEEAQVSAARLAQLDVRAFVHTRRALYGGVVAKIRRELVDDLARMLPDA